MEPIRVVFTKAALEQAAERIRQLGLPSCPVCSTSSFEIHREPVLFHFPYQTETHDPDFLTIVVNCQTCGYVLQFRADRMTRDDERMLAQVEE
jgi:C4-type Zn-finger protein